MLIKKVNTLYVLVTSIVSIMMTSSAYANKINFCSISINSSNEFREFKRRLPKQDFNFLELTNPSYDYSSDWTTGACEKLQQSNTNCDILLISGHFAGEVFFGVGRNRDKKVFTKHLLRKMCDGSCDNLLQKPKLVLLFGGNTLHEQEGATAREKQQYLRRLTKSIGPGAAQRLVEAKFGPYGKAYSDQMRRLFSPSADILGFEEAGLSGPKAAARIKSFLRRIKDFKAQFEQNYSSRSSQRSSQGSSQHEVESIVGHTASMSQNIITDSFISTFGTVSGKVCEGRPRSQPGEVADPGHLISSNICQLTDPKERYDDRIDLAGRLLASEQSSTYFPWIENFFREHPPLFKEDGTPYYDNYLENEAFKRLVSQNPTMPDNFKALIDSTDNGFTKLQQLSTARYLNWVTPQKYKQDIKQILTKEFRTLKRRGLDQDTIDLLCHLGPAIEGIIKQENLLSPYKRMWRSSIAKLNRCFASERRRRQID